MLGGISNLGKRKNEFAHIFQKRKHHQGEGYEYPPPLLQVYKRPWNGIYTYVSYLFDTNKRTQKDVHYLYKKNN